MTVESFYIGFAYLSASTTILPLVLLIYSIRKLERVDTYLAIYLLLSVITELLNFIAIQINLKTTLIETSFSIIELALIFKVFHLLIEKRLQYFRILAFGLLVVCFFKVFGSYYEWAWTAGIWRPTYMLTIVIFVLAYYKQEIEKAFRARLVDHRYFWYCTAFFYYFGSSIFLFMLDEFIVTAQYNLGLYLWIIHLLNNIIYYLILSKGAWMIRAS